MSSTSSSHPAPPAKKAKIDTADTEGKKDVAVDKETQKAMEDIDSCQNDIDSLTERASEEILKVEKKYNKLRKPFFDRRNDVIKKIPNFWIIALINHPQMTLFIHEEEEDLLHYLSKIDVDEYEDVKFGFKISLHFMENPYFDNEVLVKEFFMGGMKTRSSSTPIRWKEGKNVIQLIKDKENDNQTKKRSAAPRGLMCWFVDNDYPTRDEIAEIIKDDMWPNPLQYYLDPRVDIREETNSDYEDGEGSDDDAEDSVVIVEDEEEDDDDSVIIGSPDTDEIEIVEERSTKRVVDVITLSSEPDQIIISSESDVVEVKSSQEIKEEENEEKESEGVEADAEAAAPDTESQGGESDSTEPSDKREASE